MAVGLSCQQNFYTEWDRQHQRKRFFFPVRTVHEIYYKLIVGKKKPSSMSLSAVQWPLEFSIYMK